MLNFKKLFSINIFAPEWRHIFLLLYWPVYGLTFWFLERGITLDYAPIESPTDAMIPFCEYFIVPYLVWFAYLVWIHVHTFFADTKQFKKLMYFIMIVNTAAIITFIIYPSKQELRPTEFQRDNIFVDMVKAFYVHDTNTNVLPSLHVTGSFAVLFASWRTKGLDTPLIRSINIVLTVLISISTVFLKQHSIIDVYAALVLCAIAWPVAYILPDKIALLKSEKRPIEIKLNKKERVAVKKS